MTRTTGRRSRAWPTYARPLLLCLVATTAVGACATDGAGGTATTGPPPAATAGRTPSGDQDTTRAGETETSPARVSIPSLGIDSDLMRLGLHDDGTVEVPPAEKGMTAGWYTGNPRPGEPGAAVIIGHNDTRFGKAVFHDLKRIRKGATVEVRDSRGGTVRFTVTATESVAKDAFPTRKVYGATRERSLRLITCDGAFDAAGHPVDNLIVYAVAR
ncbi:class F sortase [Streptomyces sp. Je 1-79]|uniref:class F sortase n=1 Tax=Streptomyces sp. Je 1-79 TaxID=2943847 RepID=UPI0021A2CCA5|nr:class F sortase [Streptomyces sp. Je 1-79]MCT4352206.1 class F sortase [Streptomyces sp. Je 1-79]